MPMNKRFRTDTSEATDQDRALQADPELDMSGGRASGIQIAFAAIGSLAIIVLVLYGLNNQRDETAASAPSRTAAQSSRNQPPQQAQGQNQPADSASAQNAPQGETTGSGVAAQPGAPASGRGDSSQQGAPTQANTPAQPK